MESLKQIDFQLSDEKLTYQLIPWDSDYLHNTTAQVLSTQPDLPNPELLTQFCAQFASKDLLFVKLAPTEQEKIKWFEQGGFYIIEESLEPRLNLSEWKWLGKLSDDYHLRPMRPAEIELIRQISAQAFVSVSRYFLDPKISQTGAAERYADWVNTSLGNKEDVQVLVDAQDQVLGFFINQYAEGVADNRLIALDPARRGQGLGKELYVRMIQQAQAAGASQLISHVSAQNEIAMKFYQEFGAEFHHPQVVLHKVI